MFHVERRVYLHYTTILFIVPTSLSCSYPFVPVETWPDGYLVGKKLVILLFECVVGKCFVVFYVFSFPPSVYVGALDLIASIPGPSILTCMIVSRLMGKPTICIGENKDADQLRGNREADQRLCFRYSDSTLPLLLKSEISSF